MQMGFLGGLAVSGLILLAALAGVVMVKMTTASAHREIAVDAPASSPFSGTAQAAVEPAATPVVTTAPATFTDPLTGTVQYGRNCNGAVAEAKSIGVLPAYAKMHGMDARPVGDREQICSAETQSAMWDIAYFSRCRDGSDSCPVLARVTQEGQHVVFRRD